MAGFGERIKEVRGGMSQSQFSTMLGITQTKLSRLEREASEPDMALLEALSNHFDISLDWLIVGKGPKQESQKEAESSPINPAEIRHLQEKIRDLNAIICAKQETIDAQRVLIETLGQPEDSSPSAANDYAQSVPMTAPHSR